MVTWIENQFANYCPNLEHLKVYSCSACNALFLHHFPTLERLQYESDVKCTRINELKMFLEKHTKLKQFEANGRFLCFL